MKHKLIGEQILNPEIFRKFLVVLLLIFAFQNINAARFSKKNNSITQGIDKPNLLFIMTDQQRFDAMSCAGNLTIKTPNMDRLAREGVKFVNTYSANPVCVPSRAVLLTGLSSCNVKVEGNGDIMRDDVPDVPTFDHILKGNGYVAEYYGKWHTPYKFTECYDNDVNPIGNNFTVPHIIDAYQDWLKSKGVTKREPEEGELFSGRNMRPYKPVSLDYNFDKANLGTEIKSKLKASQSTQYGCVDLPPNISYATFNTEQTLDALERMKNVPFTLTCSFDPPHPPMVVQEPYFSMYPPKAIPVPESITDPLKDSPYKNRGLAEDELRYKDTENIQDMRSIYYGMVTEIDDKIGKILDKLDELGLAENTLVIFTSDHGEMLGDHGMHSKSIFYEGGVHVPLLMRFPKKIKAGTVVMEPVSTMDVFPTILDYMQVPAPNCDGISLRTFIEGNPVEHIVVSYSPGVNNPNYMVRVGNLKLMMSQNADAENVDALYDLDADPLEMRNLIISPISPEKNREQALEMKAHLISWMEKNEPYKAGNLKKREIFR